VVRIYDVVADLEVNNRQLLDLEVGNRRLVYYLL